MKRKLELNEKGQVQRKKLSLPTKISIAWNILIWVMIAWIAFSYFTRPVYRQLQNEAFKASWRATQELFKF